MATTRELVTARYGRDIGVGDDTEAEGVVAALLSRRSIRLYEDRPVDPGLLDVLLASAQSAPTKSNLQQYSIVVVQEKETREKLAPFVPRTKILKDVPGLLVFCADMRRGQRVTGFAGKAHANNNMDTFANATIDAALALGFFVAAAEGAGLGTAPLSSLRDFMYQVAEVLELPDGVYPIAGVMFGWPSATGYVNQRLPQSAVVHRERYDDSNLEADIAQYDETRHSAFPIPDDKQSKQDFYGIAEKYRWSEHISRQLGVPERAEFRAFLKSHGFDLA